MRALLHRQVQRIGIAGRQKDRVIRIAVIDGTYRMDHIFCRKIVSARDLSFAGMAAVELSALLKQLRSRSRVDRSVYASASQKRAVCRVYNAVRLHFRYIPFGHKNTAAGCLADAIFHLEDASDRFPCQEQGRFLRIQHYSGDIGRRLIAALSGDILFQRLPDRSSHSGFLGGRAVLIGVLARVGDLPVLAVLCGDELHLQASDGRFAPASGYCDGLYRKQDASPRMHRLADRLVALNDSYAAPVGAKLCQFLLDLFAPGKIWT